ncbi:hypothetical protein ACQZV8_09990 [Magnetococcales bacterium HHB-1]
MDDPRTTVMQSIGYEKQCGRCHSAGGRGTGSWQAESLELFTIPSIDIESLAFSQFSLGSWPRFAHDEMSPLSRLLFSQYADWIKEQDVLNRIDMSDLSQASLSQKKAVYRFGKNIKLFFHQLQQQGHEVLFQRLFSDQKNQQEPLKIEGAGWGGLSQSIVNEAVNQWFPLLNEEIDHLRKGTMIPMKKETKKSSVTDDNKKYIPPSPKKEKTESFMDHDLFLGDSLFMGEQEDLFGQKASFSTSQNQQEEKEEKKKAAFWNTRGGWWWEGTSLYYRSTGHADPFLRRWIEQMAQMPQGEASFTQLTDSKKAGQCAKCHRLQYGKKIQWSSPLHQTGRSLTQFKHYPHLLGHSEEQRCHQCHQWRKTKDASDQTLFHGFLSVEKKICIQCHKDTSRDKGCAQCHRYHIVK